MLALFFRFGMVPRQLVPARAMKSRTCTDIFQPRWLEYASYLLEISLHSEQVLTKPRYSLDGDLSSA